MRDDKNRQTSALGVVHCQSYTGAIGEQQLKQAKLIVAFIKIMHVC